MTIRIHSGRLKGTRIAVADYTSLRPTSSRLRETLGNWLRPMLPLGHVLDLFAGSGALGMEVYSQAESTVTFVDNNSALIKAIAKDGSRLGMTKGHFITANARNFIQTSQERYDLILLDPPYALDWLSSLPRLVEQSGITPDNGLIYLELARTREPNVPENWRQIKRAEAGQVQIMLYKKIAPSI